MSAHHGITPSQPLPHLYLQQEGSAMCLVAYVHTQQWLFHMKEGFVVWEDTRSLLNAKQTKRPMTKAEAARFLDRIEAQVAQEPKNSRLAELYTYAISWYYADVVGR